MTSSSIPCCRNRRKDLISQPPFAQLGRLPQRLIRQRLKATLKMATSEVTQFGFVPGRWTEKAICKALTHIDEARARAQAFQRIAGQGCRGVKLKGSLTLSVDMSKAFDTVNRVRLHEAPEAESADTFIVEVVGRLHIEALYEMTTSDSSFSMATRLESSSRRYLSPRLHWTRQIVEFSGDAGRPLRSHIAGPSVRTCFGRLWRQSRTHVGCASLRRRPCVGPNNWTQTLCVGMRCWKAWRGAAQGWRNRQWRSVTRSGLLGVAGTILLLATVPVGAGGTVLLRCEACGAWGNCWPAASLLLAGGTVGGTLMHGFPDFIHFAQGALLQGAARARFGGAICITCSGGYGVRSSGLMHVSA